jgi:protein associated with RNAse G/E
VSVALLHSTKYDGSLHYRFGVETVLQHDDLLITYSAVGLPMESYRQRATTTMHMLAVFQAAKPYNLHVAWHADWRPKMHYVNIATPATWHDGAVRYVDLDLDVIRLAGSNEVVLDDADEFERHREFWRYPADLCERCLQAVGEVRGLFQRGEWPFTDALYAWRPGQPI